jgi:hypothetical protein
MRLKNKCVGWAKRPGPNAFGGVSTTCREDIRFKKWWARRRCAFAHPTDCIRKEAGDSPSGEDHCPKGRDAIRRLGERNE